MPQIGLTSACPPGDRTLWQCSHFRQKRCQFLPRELTFSAVGNKVEPGCQSPSFPPSAPSCFWETVGSVSRRPAPSRQSAGPTARRESGVAPAPVPRVLREPSGSHSPSFLPLLSPGLTEENGLLATWAGPTHGSAQVSWLLHTVGTQQGLRSTLSTGSTHDSAWSLIGLNPLFLKAH